MFVLENGFSVATGKLGQGGDEFGRIPFGTVATLNLTDPDSMTLTPSGDVLLDDQGDGQLTLLRSSGDEPRVQYLPLLGQVQVDDNLTFRCLHADTLYANTQSVIQLNLTVNGSDDAGATGDTDPAAAIVSQNPKLSLCDQASSWPVFPNVK